MPPSAPAHGGMKVILFEERALGGVCLNEGCIPTKTLLNSAKLYLGALHSEAFGVTVSGASIDHAKVVDRKDKVVRTLVSGVAAKMKGAGVTVGFRARVVAGKSADGYSVTALGETYTAEKLLICTGSEAVIPPVAGLREAYENGLCVTNREVLELREVPKKLVVIGGGVIGLETASYFAAVGSDVTVVEMLPKIAGPTVRTFRASFRGISRRRESNSFSRRRSHRYRKEKRRKRHGGHRRKERDSGGGYGACEHGTPRAHRGART